MNDITINTISNSLLTLKTTSEMSQRHETHLEMETSTHELLSNNPNEWSKEEITLNVKLE